MFIFVYEFEKSEEIDEQTIGLQRLRNMLQTIKADQEKLVIESDLMYNENQGQEFMTD